MMMQTQCYNMKVSDIDLKSSLREQGKYVTQIFHFVGGIKRTYDGIKVDNIRQGQFTKFKNDTIIFK